MLGIIVAIDDEIEYFLNNAVLLETYSDTVKTFYHLAKGKKEFILAKSGAGKVNASMTTTKMIDKYDEFNINIKNVCSILGAQVLDFVCMND